MAKEKIQEAAEESWNKWCDKLEQMGMTDLWREIKKLKGSNVPNRGTHMRLRTKRLRTNAPTADQRCSLGTKLNTS